MIRPGSALLTLALIGACHGGQKAADDSGPAVTGVRTAVATLEPFPEAVNVIGTVNARPGRYAALAAPGPTRVARIFVVPGQRVSKGDSLVEFERAPFDAAAQSAAAALSGAERNAARAARLAQAGILPQKDADQAAADLAAAQSAAVTARRAQELATLRAPLAGVVTRMTAILGASVDASQTVVEVADPAALDVVFNVSPAEAGRIQTGDTLTLTGTEGGARESLGSARVVSVAVAVDSVTRAVAVRAHLSVGRPAATRPLGQIITGVHANAVSVPVEALVPEGEGFRVYVVDSSGIAHARPVVVGGRSEARVEIVRGLGAGERVVTTGAYGVTDSAKIGTEQP